MYEIEAVDPKKGGLGQPQNTFLGGLVFRMGEDEGFTPLLEKRC